MRHIVYTFTKYFYYYGDEDLRNPRKKEPGDN
eukprot:SAG11_NODE_42657_length_176_cov_17.923077_1_plen_31_part_10